MARISLGKNYENASVQATPVTGGAPQSSSAGPIATGQLGIPSLEGVQQIVNNFVQPAQGPTMGGPPQITPSPRLQAPPSIGRPQEIRALNRPNDWVQPNQIMRPSYAPYVDNMSGLAKALSAWSDTFQDIYQGMEKDAAAEAKGVASSLITTGADPTNSLDVIRRRAENLMETGETPEIRMLAEKRFNMLENIDPRVNRHLVRAYEVEQGIHAVNSLGGYIQGLEENGQPFIVNPYPTSDQPDPLGIAMSSYVSKFVKNPSVFAELSPRIQAAYANVRSGMSRKHAEVQQRKRINTFKKNLSIVVGDLSIGSEDQELLTTGVNANGETNNIITKALDDFRSNGGSVLQSKNTQENIVSWLAQAVIATSDDWASLSEKTELLEEYLKTAEIGPKSQAKRPLLVDALGGEDNAIAALRTAVSDGYKKLDNAQEAAKTGAGETQQENSFTSVRESVLELIEQDQPLKATKAVEAWSSTQLNRILEEEDTDIRSGMFKEYERQIDVLNKTVIGPTQNGVYNELKDKMDSGLWTANQLKAAISLARKNKHITITMESELMKDIRLEVQEEDAEMKEIVETAIDGDRDKASAGIMGAVIQYYQFNEDDDGKLTGTEEAEIVKLRNKLRRDASNIIRTGRAKQQEESEIQEHLSKFFIDEREKWEKKLVDQNQKRINQKTEATKEEPIINTPRETIDSQTPVEILEGLSPGVRGNSQENERILTRLRQGTLNYDRDVFFTQVTEIEKGVPLEKLTQGESTYKLIQRMGIKPQEFFELIYKSHHGMKEPPPEFRKMLKEKFNRRAAAGVLSLALLEPKPSLSLSERMETNLRMWSQPEEILIASSNLQGLLKPPPPVPVTDKTDLEILEIIRGGESAGLGGYNAINQGGAKGGHEVLGYSGPIGDHPKHKGKKLTSMTIGEIKKLQDSKGYGWTKKEWDRWYNDGGLHAVGAYQFTADTLPEAAELAGFGDDTLFTPVVQDRMGITLFNQYAWDKTKWISVQDHPRLNKLRKLRLKTNKAKSSTITK